MTSEHRARITIPTAPNLRDLGGWPTKDGGRIRTGLVFRSAELSRLAGEDLTAFGALGIGTVCDLRTTHELDDRPDVLPDGLRTTHLDVLADKDQAAPAEIREMLAQPALAGELLGDGQAERYFEQAYRDFVTLASARAAYGQLFRAIADIDREPLLFHCATGKDRTGWATAALLLLLGVSEEDVMEEYLQTNTDLLPMTQPWLDRFREVGGDPALFQPIVGVQESYLESALEQMRTSYGDIESYFTQGLGLSEATAAKLRAGPVDSGGGGS
ncbi:MAG: Protein tyrosine/serine phosphatase [Marmoricola sp.]|nr:Protein tyrosine/serine phosphatase [Marmoricola sp.]